VNESAGNTRERQQKHRRKNNEGKERDQTRKGQQRFEKEKVERAGCWLEIGGEFQKTSKSRERNLATNRKNLCGGKRKIGKNRPSWRNLWGGTRGMRLYDGSGAGGVNRSLKIRMNKEPKNRGRGDGSTGRVWLAHRGGTSDSQFGGLGNSEG